MHADHPQLVDRLNKIVVQSLSPVAERLGWEPKPNEGFQFFL